MGAGESHGSVSYTHLDVYKRQGKLVGRSVDHFCVSSGLRDHPLSTAAVYLALVVVKEHRQRQPG